MNLAAKSPLAQWTMSDQPIPFALVPVICLGPESDLHEHIASSTLLYLIFLASSEQDQRALRSSRSFSIFIPRGSLEHLLWSSLESRVGQTEAGFLTA
jgi:hypothetical protein